MSHTVAHITRHVTHPSIPAAVAAYWHTNRRLTPPMVRQALTDADPGDPHPLATFVAELRRTT